jgi:competence protein ComEC
LSGLWAHAIMSGSDKKWVFGILLFLFFANFLVWNRFFEIKNERFLKVVFFDVGQGDSIFIEGPCSHQILIDGGPDNKVLEKLSQNMPFWDNSLDLVVLTHPDYDHLSGLIEVLKRYEVENILWTGVSGKTNAYDKWIDSIEKEDLNTIISQKGLKISSESCSAGNIEMEVIYPFENLEGREVKDINESSIVLKMDFKKSSFLFTGDITEPVEDQLEKVNADLLKVAHHGSKTSTSEDFLNKVSPMIAVISSGKDNSYGHPHKEVLERLKRIEVLRTDHMGDIEILNDGKVFFF